jgi:phosphatidylglycerophosphate synthase
MSRLRRPFFCVHFSTFSCKLRPRETRRVTDPPDDKRPASPSPAAPKAVLLRATAHEVVGSTMHVAGMSIIERSIKQIDRMGYTIVLASDGSCPLPKYLPASVIVHRVPKPDDLWAVRREMPGLVEIPADVVRPSSRSLEGGLRVTDQVSRKRAEDAVFAELMRGDLGFVARHLNKPVSFFITRHLLCHMPVTPNQVSIGAALFGLCGAALIATGSYPIMLWGFFLAHVQSILDGCDGELARVRLRQTAFGEWLDSLVDDGLNIALFIALGIGFFRGTGVGLYLAAGLAAAAMHAFYDVVALWEIRRQGESGEIIKVAWRLAGSASLKNRLRQGRGGLALTVVTMGRRDFFIFAFLVYALLGWLRLTLLHASLVATSLFVVAAAQVIWRLRGSPE